MKLTQVSALLLCASASALATASHAAPPSPAYAAGRPIPGPDGGWDLLSVDEASQHLYVARSGGVMRVDLASGQVTPDVVKLQRGHGALAIPGGDLVLATSGGEGKAVLFHGPTGEVVATIPVGKNPDAVAYDPATKTAWVMNAGSGDASVVDPKTGAVVATVPIGGSLELGVADGAGRLFINVEDRNDVAVVDTRARKLLKRLPLAGCDGPTGIAYARSAKLIISACANGVAKLTRPDGGDAGSVPIGAHPDGAAFDQVRGVALVPSGSDAKLTVFRVSPKAEVIEQVATATGARTIALDEKTGTAYLPAADYKPAVGGGRPQALPGSFRVVVVAPAAR